MRQLFVTDLDGTLLNSQSRVSDTSARILSHLTDQGALITVATARTPATVVPLLSHTRIKGPAIVMTGAALYDLNEQKFIHRCVIPDNTVTAIIDILHEAHLNAFVYNVDAADPKIINTYYFGTPSAKEQKFIDERSHLSLKRIHINRSDLSITNLPGETSLIFCLGPADAIIPAAQALRESGMCSVSDYPDIFNHTIRYLEIFAPGVSKANAIERLRRHYSADRLIVFGDNLNDLPMMRIADTAVAVANALEAVREAADIVIESNDTDAVARFIAEHFNP
ncbi:MAG: HAD family hydrolase [Paramuribaculum sp.]|nr:HAD family hydrolase [Paramuribaculum sp.]